MKKSKLLVAVAAFLAMSVAFSSCIGNFALTNKVKDWNNSLGHKAVNELVFICFHILPVYEITIFVDLIVCNSAEFWTGNSLISETKTVKANDKTYSIAATENGYTIKNKETKAVLNLNFDAEDQSWSAEKDGQEVKFMTVIDENHVQMYGSDQVIELSPAGVMEYSSLMATAMK
jgi:hypothetical protein